LVLGMTDADDRFVYRAMPGHGVRTSSAMPCPDDAGSHLSYDGERLYLSQWYNQRLVALDDTGPTGRVIDVPHQIVGQTIVDGRFYLLTTDDETSGEYWISRVDAREPSATCEDIAAIHFDARGLAYDGERFWTNHREAHQTVAFSLA
jgi:hypothetical protein